MASTHNQQIVHLVEPLKQVGLSIDIPIATTTVPLAHAKYRFSCSRFELLSSPIYRIVVMAKHAIFALHQLHPFHFHQKMTCFNYIPSKATTQQTDHYDSVHLGKLDRSQFPDNKCCSWTWPSNRRMQRLERRSKTRAEKITTEAEKGRSIEANDALTSCDIGREYAFIWRAKRSG